MDPDDWVWLGTIRPINHEQEDSLIDRQCEEFKKQCRNNNKDPNQQLMSQIRYKLPLQQQPPGAYNQNRLCQLKQIINERYYSRTQNEIVHELKEEQHRVENKDRRIHDLCQRIKADDIQLDVTEQEKQFIQENIQELKNSCSGQMMENLQNAVGEIGGNQGWNKKVLLSSIPKRVSEWELIERQIPGQIKDMVKNKLVKGLYDLRLNQQSIMLQSLLTNEMKDVISINFTNCNFTNQSIQQLVDLSQKILNVTTLYLSFNQFTVLTKQQLDKMKGNMKYLRRIYVLNSKDSSAKMLLPSSVRDVLEFMYQQQQLKSQQRTVVIMNQWDLFQQQFLLQKMTFLNPLAFSKVSKLNLHGNKLTNKDFVILSNLISQFPQLTELDISNNGFSSFEQKSLQIIYEITKHRQQILSINLCELVGNCLDQSTLRLFQIVFQSKKGTRITIVCDRKLRLQNELILRAKNELRKGLEGVLRNLAAVVEESFLSGQMQDVDKLIVKLNRMVPVQDIRQIIETVSDRFVTNTSTATYTKSLSRRLSNQTSKRQSQHEPIQQSTFRTTKQQSIRQSGEQQNSYFDHSLLSDNKR